MIFNSLTNFLSNKYNLWGLIILSNLLIGYIIGQYLTVGQLWLVFILVFVNNFCMLTYGMAQGMLMLSMTQKAMKEWLDKMERQNKNDTK